MAGSPAAMDLDGGTCRPPRKRRKKKNKGPAGAAAGARADDSDLGDDSWADRVVVRRAAGGSSQRVPLVRPAHGHSPVAHASSDARFTPGPGTVARLQGLAADALNGQIVEVLGLPNESGRCPVKFRELDRKPISVKLSNIALLTAEQT